MRNRMMAKKAVYWLVFTLCLFAGQVQAVLMITPFRVVLDEKTRTAEVTLLNTTEKTNVYRMSWQDKEQTGLGSYINVDMPEENQHGVSEMVRQSPRKVTIEPGKYQRIRLRLRMPTDLPDGEYRSHLVMKAVDEGLNEKEPVEKVDSVVVKLTARVSFSIPIMVRKGQNNSTASISTMDLDASEPGKPKLTVGLAHSGEFSSYGSVKVYMKNGVGGDVLEIGDVGNVALFRETTLRKLTVPLKIPEIPRGAIVQVVYDGEDEYEAEQLATAAFTYNP